MLDNKGGQQLQASSRQLWSAALHMVCCLAPPSTAAQE
jgi:hypothetical protein